MPSLTILHTNDFHNRLPQQLADLLRTRRMHLNRSGLLLDAGDAISAGNITFKPGGEPILDLMNEVGYDAMTVGNREFHFSAVGFRTKLNRARFPVLCANVRAKTDEQLPVQPAVHFAPSGIRVTVFGLTVPMITERMMSRHASAWVFDDPLKTAEKIVPPLREDCDLLICLSHIGIGRDRELLQRVPGIDLLIGGHTHAVVPNGERVHQSLLVQAGSHGRFWGEIDISGARGEWKMDALLHPVQAETVETRASNPKGNEKSL
jgi:2',3'-cyclic-nucleotide 2'-phosphodiesterase (5'-nucleotidase family)